MGTGEYVSVSAQRDTERAMLAREQLELTDHPNRELDELVGLYQARGLSEILARQVVEQLTEHDAFTAHARAELDIDPNR